MKTNNELQIIEQPNELATIAKESGIELSKAETITLKYVPFLLKIREADESAKKINFENPSELDEKIAREIRLSLVPNRTAADKLKKESKAEAVLINGLEDDAFGIVEKTSKLLELKLSNVEKQREIVAKAKIEATRLERVELIKQYGENYAAMDLGNMDSTMFESILNGAKLAYEAKIKAELEIENARIEREKQAVIDAENQRLEMERLKKENEAKEKQLELERIEAAKVAKAAKHKADTELAEQKRLADIEAKKQADIIAKQKAEADRLAAELKAKADAELKEKQRIEAENKAKLEAEKKAAKAPDKIKMLKTINDLTLAFTDLKDNDSTALNEVILQKFDGFKNWALTQINNL
jgi:hypothetical protein